MSQQMNHSSITWFLEERLHESIRRKSRVAELQAVAQAENDEIGSTNSINSINSTNYIQGLNQLIPVYRSFLLVNLTKNIQLVFIQVL